MTLIDPAFASSLTDVPRSRRTDTLKETAYRYLQGGLRNSVSGRIGDE